MSSDGSSSFVGKIVNVLGQKSVIGSTVSQSSIDLALGANKALAGGNGSGASTIDLTAEQLLLAQIRPIVIVSAHATNDIVLRPNGLAAGNPAAYFLQQTFQLSNVGDVATIMIAQSGTATAAVVLNGSTGVDVSISLPVALVSIAASVVGDTSDSEVVISTSSV